MDKLKFNDFGLISIVSCGYVVNRAKMTAFKVPIANGDTIKMLKNRSGELRWYCNDIEIAVADLGPSKDDNLYPMIGLGHLCDEVELIAGKYGGHEKDHEGYRREL